MHRLVTNLGVFDFGGPGHTLRFVSVHPGVSLEEVREASGCEIHADGDVPETRTPTEAELVLIRELLDPTKIREREVPTP